MKNLIIKKETVKIFIFVIIYKIILDLAYYFIISPIWAYAKFTFQFNAVKLIESYVLLFIVFLLIPKSSKKISSIIIWGLFLISYVPMLTLFALMDESRIFMYAATFFWAIVYLIMRIKIPKLNIKKLKQSKIIRRIIFITIPVISFFLIYKYLGLKLNFSFVNEYEIRSHYISLNIPFAGYILNWSAIIIIPFLSIFFFIKKKWIPLILVLMLQIILFSATGHKSYLFITPFIFAISWIASKKYPIKWMLLGLLAVVIISSLSYYLIDDIWLPSLFIRRTLFVPAQLTFFYCDFFSDHQFTFFSQHRFFRNFIDYPYHLDPPHLIAENYYNKDSNANNGIVSDGYMNLGFIGMFIWAILLSFILKLTNRISDEKNIKLSIALVGFFVFTIISSALLTSLITHGFFLSLLLLYLLPKKIPQKNE